MTGCRLAFLALLWCAADSRSITNRHDEALKDCNWTRSLPQEYGEDAVLLACKLRTIDGTNSVVGNLSVPQIERILAMRIECSDVLFFESTLGSGFLSQLRRLRELTIESCKIRRMPPRVLSSLRELRNLTVRTHNSEWLAMTMEFDPDSFRGLSELRVLDLADNNIWTFPAELFCPLYSLARLSVSRNRLQDVREMGFAHCSLSIELLDVSHNDVATVPGSALSGLRSLRELYLQENVISSLADRAFVGLAKLELLNASSNFLVALPPELFHSTRVLRELYLCNNSISVLAPGLLEGLDHLTVLDLSRNELTTDWLNRNTFNGLVRLVVLNLSHNNIARVDAHLFNDVYSLQVLNLAYNDIESIAEGAFNRLSNLHVLTLSHNKLVHLQPYYFSGLYVVSQLYVDNNHLGDVHAKAFENCTHLQDLGLSRNQLTDIPAGLGKLLFLRTLDLGYNAISSVSNVSLDGMYRLHDLSLMRNRLKNIHHGAFFNLTELQMLNLANNKVRFVDAGAFANNPQLRMLRLDGNELSDISGIVSHLPGLAWLNVSDNRIQWFDYSFLPSSLEWLDLHKNYITELRNYDYNTSKLRIRMLDASYNQLTDIQEYSIPDSVETLYLNNNRIVSVAANTFLKKVNLTRVVFYGNNIEKMELAALALYPVPEDRELPQFYISGNPFQCDCSMEWLQRINQLTHLRQHPRVLDLDTVMCKLTHSKGEMTVPLFDMSPSQFLCPYQVHCFALCHCCDFDACDCEMTCPDNCTCLHDHTWSANIVDCSNAGYTSVPQRIPMDATELYLDGNDLGELGSHVFIGKKKLEVLYLNNSNVNMLHNRTFNGVTSLRILHLENNHLHELRGYEFEKLNKLSELYLDHNGISRVGNGTFKTVPSLEVLRLDENQLTDFSPWQQLNPGTRTRVSLGGGNTWHCDCESAFRLAAWADGQADRMSCHGGYSLAEAIRRCKEAVATSSVVQSERRGGALSVVPFVAGAVALLFVAVAAALLYRFRNELRLWAHSRYGIRQPDRDDDRERLYDAYVVYSLDDDDFAERVLAAELEQSGYAVCLQYRDIQSNAGAAYLTESVASAAEASRRLLLVLSAGFLAHEWARPDFREALAPVLVRHRVVVLATCEPDDELRPLLRGSVVIAWGERRCWDRLRFAMPDVRKRVGKVDAAKAEGKPRYSAAPRPAAAAAAAAPATAAAAPAAPTPTPTQSTYVSENSSQRTTDDEEDVYGHHHKHHAYLRHHVYSSIPDGLPLRPVSATGRTYFV